MNQDAKPDKALFDRVKDKFDRVLKRHIRRLLDAGESDNTPPYSLNMIACLLVLAEREKEITVFPGSPPKRYTRQTFLKDLQEIGIEPDDSIMVEIQDLSQAGYIYIGGDDEYRAREPALKFLSLLDAIFPSMQGLSLIAYILQAVEEVLTNRKELIHAVRQFDETLLTRGESVSKQRFEAMRRQRAEAARKKFDPAAQKQREAYLERLNALRSKGAETSSDPAIVTTTGYTSKIEVRDLFPKAPEEPEPDEAPPPPPTGEAAPSLVPDEPLPASPPTPEPTPQPVEEAVLPPPSPPTAADAISSESEPGDITTDEQFEAEGEESEEEVSEEDEIAQRIKAFEEHLAMACPVCKEGRILSDSTGKGKTYYYCSNKNCNLVTWGKPYHVACPLCENPFLVEFQQQEGGIGLKCPRGTCSFVHRDFDGKHLPGSGAGDGSPVRKVAIRRKGGKRAVRRVIRRK
jgi:hypothetical protein